MAARSFLTLAAAAEACASEGISFERIAKRGKRWTIRDKPKAEPKPKAKRKPKARRERATSGGRVCSAKTPEDKRDRAAAWTRQREALREIRDDERRATADYRERETKRAKDCREKRAALKRDCTTRQKKELTKLQQARADAHARRAEDWQSYRARTCGIAGKGRRYSAAESDSLAEGSIPDRLVKLWRARARSYSLDQSPDARAEKFLEDVEGYTSRDVLEGDDLAELLALEDEPDYDAAYARHVGRGEEIPF